MTQETKQYELSYLLAPAIPAEEVESKLAAIRAMIEKHEGSFIGEEAPRLRPLAYEIRKSVANKIARYSQAYMGSLYFEAPSVRLPEIAEALRMNDLVIRSLVVDFHPSAHVPEARVEGEVPASPSGDEGAGAPVETKEEIEQKIDAEIDNLIAANS